MQRTHIELVVMQGAAAKKVESKKDTVKKAQPVSADKKTEVKKTEVKPSIPQKPAAPIADKNIPTKVDKK